MIRKTIFISEIILVFMIFLFVLIPAKDALASQCRVQINFQAQPNPVAENKPLIFSGYVGLEGSVWEPQGASNAGYCTVGSYPLKEIKISIESSKFPGALVTKLISLKPLDVGPYSYFFSWAPSSVNLKSGSNFDVYAVALGYNGEIYQQLTKSSAINVNVTAPVSAREVNAENCKAAVSFDINPKMVASVNDQITLTATLTVTNPQACQSGFDNIGADFQFYWTSGHSTLINSGWTVFDLGGSPATFTKNGSITTKLSDLGFTTTQSSISFYVRIQAFGLKAGEAQKTDAIINDPSRYKFDVTSRTANLGVNQEPAPVRKYSCVANKCQFDPNGNYSGIESCLSICEGGAFTPPPSSGGGTPTTTQYVFNLPNPIGVTNFQDLVNIIGKWIFSLAIPIAVIVIIYAGVLMLTAGARPAQFQKGAKALWYAVIGLAVVLIGKGFVTLIQSILNLRNQ